MAITWEAMSVAKKLCKLAKKGKIDEIGALALDARFVCAKCGRAAANSENLCKPRKIEGDS